MSVFDEWERTDDRPWARNERLYDFYDRTSRRPFAVFRALVNEWAGEMAAADRSEPVARMRNGDDQGFATGLSEVMLHAASRRLGLTLEAHPAIPNTANRLDYLIRRPDGERLAYIEITSMNPPAAEVARDRREAVVFEALNGAALPEDLRLTYGVRSYGKASPSAARIKASVESWAADSAEAARQRGRVRQVFELDDWRFDLSLIGGFKPRPGGRQIAAYGLLNGRVLGAVPSAEGLAKALDAKARRYGDLDLPYVIAVFDRTGSLAWSRDVFAENVANVLFGSEFTETAVLRSGDAVTRDGRARNGWFGQPGSPRRRGVSAVLVFPSAEPWHLAEARGQPLLVMHPWTPRPLPDGFLPVQELIMNDQEGRIAPGRLMSDILNLPDPWPPTE